eukprot:TRINITY_DN21779_c0_g1_i1.p1 TRINITY_DN21779_c0_g1~~TRINITY_DN21779_c0_g1_i1.p1  ORF type:complete len:458 (-),score=79.41 TRINITY_DN21779_c0_g1_i1:122-1495(-)
MAKAANDRWRLEDAFNNTVRHVTYFFQRVTTNSPIQILKRLQREVFSDLVKIKDRLYVLEKRWTQYNQDGMSGTKTQLKGEVNTAGIFLLGHALSGAQLTSLHQTRVKAGLQTKFKFDTFFRERDILVTEFISGQSFINDNAFLGAPLSLGKVLYSAHINDALSICFAPFGGKAKDSAFLPNLLQDCGLTDFSNTGPEIFRQCQGSSIAGTLKCENFAFSLGRYLSNFSRYESESLQGILNTKTSTCSSTLGQIAFQPVEGILFAVTYLNRFLSSTSTPSLKLLNWGKFGSLSLHDFCSQGSQNPDRFSRTPDDQQLISDHSSSFAEDVMTHSIAVQTDVELKDGIRFGGWLQIDGPITFQKKAEKSLQWFIGISELPENEGGWGLGIGRSRNGPLTNLPCQTRDFDAPEVPTSQMQVEAFLSFHLGKGFTFNPGLLYTLDKNGHTPAMVLRTNWSF